VLLALVPGVAWAMCNIIPPAEQVYPSTLGSVASPVTLAGNTVEIRLGACDGNGFDATAGNNQVAISFLPAGAGQPPPVLVDPGTFIVAECAGAGGTSPCNDLRFTMPDTPGLVGPVEITVTVGATVVADIGTLYLPHPYNSTCDKQPETIFQQFTVLPPANNFAAAKNGTVFSC
jgi:hypothetical protein